MENSCECVSEGNQSLVVDVRRFEMQLKQFLIKNSLKWVIIVSLVTSVAANPDAKRLYDDLLSNYNRLIRPVSNNTDTVLVKLGLRLSQLIDLVSEHVANSH